MLHQRMSILTIIAAICLAVAGLAQAGVIEESATLERAYVPALALTNQPLKPSVLVQTSIERLEKAWRIFVQSTSPQIKTNADFAKAVTDSNQKISEAKAFASAGKRHDAHESLEYIRTAFWKVRTAMGIEYLPDRFTAFHDPMEVFVEQASMPETDTGKLKTSLAELSRLWGDIEKSGINVDLFKLSPDQANRYDGLVKKERDILSLLADLIGFANSEVLAKAAGSLKSNFAQIYFVFGDFSGLQ